MGWALPTPEQRYSEPLPRQPREVETNNILTGLEEAFQRQALIQEFIQNGVSREEAFQQVDTVLRPGAYINGGGMSAAWSAGKVVACVEKGLFTGDGFSFVMGSSAGALIMLYAALEKTEAVKIFYEDLIDHEVIDTRPGKVKEKGGVIDFRSFEDILRTERFKLTEEDLHTLRNFPIPLLAGVTPTDIDRRRNPQQWGKPEYRDLRYEKDPIRTVIASMKLPLANIPNVELDGRFYADGGLAFPIPLDIIRLLRPSSMTYFLNSPQHIGRAERWLNAQQARLGEQINHFETSCIFVNSHNRNDALSQIETDPTLSPSTVLSPTEPQEGVWQGLVCNEPVPLEAAVREGFHSMMKLLHKIQGRLFPDTLAALSEYAIPTTQPLVFIRRAA